MDHDYEYFGGLGLGGPILASVARGSCLGAWPYHGIEGGFDSGGVHISGKREARARKKEGSKGPKCSRDLLQMSPKRAREIIIGKAPNR